MKSKGGSQGKEQWKDVQGHAAACWFSSPGSVCYSLLLANPSIIIHTMKVSGFEQFKYYLTIKSHDRAETGRARHQDQCPKKLRLVETATLANVFPEEPQGWCLAGQHYLSSEYTLSNHI